MASNEPPRESEPNRNVEQGETANQTGPKPGNEAVGKVENTLSKRNICPYLGLRDDRTVVSMQATPAHACYATRQRYLPSLDHQRERCLGMDYTGCKLYPDKKPDNVANNRIYGLQGELIRDRRSRRRWLGWLAAAPLLIVLGTFAYAVWRGLLPLPLPLVYNPVPTAQVSVAGSDGAITVVPDVPETPTEISTKANPTETSAEALTLTPPDSTPAVVAQSAQPTARSTPNPIVVTPVVTTPATKAAAETATEVATEIATKTSVPTLTRTPLDSTPTAVAQGAQPTVRRTPNPTVVTPVATAAATKTATETSIPTPTRTPPGSTPAVAAQSVQPTVRGTSIPVTATPDTEGGVLTISPSRDDVGWWSSAQTQTGQIGDSFLYAGVNEAQAYISVVRFDLDRVPSSATIQSAILRLTGLRDDQLERSGNSTWSLQVISESALPELAGETFFTLFEVPAAFDLVPNVGTANVGPGIVNEWTFDIAMREWLYQQLLGGATSVVVRIVPRENPGNALFAWDSGQGTESSGAAPEMVLELGPAAPTPALP